jgi:hypothetical protein
MKRQNIILGTFTAIVIVLTIAIIAGGREHVRIDKDEMCKMYNTGTREIFERHGKMCIYDIVCPLKYVEVHRKGFSEKVETRYNCMGVYILKDNKSYDGTGTAYLDALTDDDYYNDNGLPYFIERNELDDYGRENYIELEQPYHI